MNFVQGDLEEAMGKLPVECIDLESLVNKNPLLEAPCWSYEFCTGDLEEAMGNLPVENIDLESLVIKNPLLEAPCWSNVYFTGWPREGNR